MWAPVGEKGKKCLFPTLNGEVSHESVDDTIQSHGEKKNHFCNNNLDFHCETIYIK